MHSQVNEDAEVMVAADTQPPVDPRSLIVYETRTRQNRSKSTPGTPILQSDIAPLQAEHVESIQPIRRARSARTIPDDESDGSVLFSLPQSMSLFISPIVRSMEYCPSAVFGGSHLQTTL